MNYYTIGKFAKLTGVSTKTLIWYDNIGLLKPDKVNEINGYRYYTNESLKKIFSIKFLQSMDFTINQIMKFSKEEIQNKLKQLEEKIRFIQINKFYLDNFVKQNPSKFKLEVINKNELNGKWLYQKSTQNFDDALIGVNNNKIDEIAESLFFGETIGTDTCEIFTFTNNEVSFRNKKYDILLINNGTKLILYELNAKENKIEYHIYTYTLKSQTYNDTEIKMLFEKQKSKINKDNAQSFDLIDCVDKSLQGNWNLLGEIKESELANFDKNNIQKILIQIWSPAFENLNVDGNVVDVLRENQKYVFFDKIFKASDIKCKILKSKNNYKEYLHFEIFDVYYELLHFKKDEKEYLCLNVDNDLNIDEKLYIYEKVD